MRTLFMKIVVFVIALSLLFSVTAFAESADDSVHTIPVEIKQISRSSYGLIGSDGESTNEADTCTLAVYIPDGYHATFCKILGNKTGGGGNQWANVWSVQGYYLNTSIYANGTWNDFPISIYGSATFIVQVHVPNATDTYNFALMVYGYDE